MNEHFLSGLAESAIDFAVIVIIVSILSALIIEGIGEARIRRIIQRRALIKWISNRIKALYRTGSDNKEGESSQNEKVYSSNENENTSPGLSRSWQPERWSKDSAIRSVLDKLEMFSEGDKQEPAVERASKKVHNLLEQLLGIENQKSFYELPPESICEHVSSGVQNVLDYPARHKSLLIMFASAANAGDLEDILGNDVEISSAKKEERSKYLNTEKRIVYQIERAIDELRLGLSGGYRWNYFLLSLIFSMTFVSFFMTSGFAKYTLEDTNSNILIGAIVLVSSVTSPVIRTILQRWGYL